MIKPDPKWREQLGITPGNPFAQFGIVLSVLVTVASITLIFFMIAGTTARTRFNAGVTLLFVGGFAPIAIMLLIVYARNYARIRSVAGGNYWVHWQDGENDEVFISPLGVYYPNREKYTLKDFSHKLQDVEIPADFPSELHLHYLYLRKWSATFAASRYDKEIVVEIPQGREDEARALVKRFQSEIGKASPLITDQLRFVWQVMFGIMAFVFLWAYFVISPLADRYKDEINAKKDLERAALQEKQAAEVRPQLSSIRAVIDPQISRLSNLPDGEMTAKDAGFEESSGVARVLYGHCSEGKDFYVFAVLRKDILGRSYFGGPGSFDYTTRTDRLFENCHPEHASVAGGLQLGDGWYYGNFSSQ